MQLQRFAKLAAPPKKMLDMNGETGAGDMNKKEKQRYKPALS
jgi:hypothetical protein